MDPVYPQLPCANSSENFCTILRAVEQSPTSILITDHRGNIEYVNPRFTEVTGYTKAEVLGQNPRIFKSNLTPNEVYHDLWLAISMGGEWRGEICNLKKDGTPFWEYAIISGLLDESGKTSHYIAVKDDITERKKQVELNLKLKDQLQQSQKMELVGRLAGGIAHDFNNMLGAILGNLDMALEHLNPGEPTYEDLMDARQAALRSADLTRQILTFARKQVIAPKVLDLNETLSGILTMLQRIVGENVRINWMPDADLWRVNIDPSQVDQILANLCINARDAIIGSGNITVKTGNCTLDAVACQSIEDIKPGKYVWIEVRDDGTGMDKKTLDRLFEPFFTTKAVGMGTGLGLSMVYGIVKQNQGSIHILSELDVGTTFTIYLPQHLGRKEQSQAPKPERDHYHGHGTILLVEDEPFVLKVVKNILECDGYSVISASNGQEALEKFQTYKSEITLLLTDVIMPGISGVELSKEILTECPKIKCLFMSGYTAGVITRSFEEKSFIQKPFSKQNLLAKLQSLLEGVDQLKRTL